MKNVLLYLFPFIFSLVVVYYISLNKQASDFLFETPKSSSSVKPDFNFIGNFENDNAVFEDQFLKSSDSTETIFLLGSSELVYQSPAIPYNFISSHFKTKLKAVGHAGNQCFSIYTQLLANYQRLNNAPVVVIISPGWFESKASKGTTSKIFLEWVMIPLRFLILKKMLTHQVMFLYTCIKEKCCLAEM
jgi:poly-D-alanine transfer protein DltD